MNSPFKSRINKQPEMIVPEQAFEKETIMDRLKSGVDAVEQSFIKGDEQLTKAVANSYDFITHLPLRLGSGIKQIVDHKKAMQAQKDEAIVLAKQAKAESVQAFVSKDDSELVLKGHRPFIGPIKSTTGRKGVSFVDHPSQRYDFALNTVKKEAYAKKTLINAKDLKAMAKQIKRDQKSQWPIEKRSKRLMDIEENKRLIESGKKRVAEGKLRTAKIMANIRWKAANPRLARLLSATQHMVKSLVTLAQRVFSQAKAATFSIPSRLLTVMRTIDQGIRNITSGLYGLIKSPARWIYQWRHPKPTSYHGQYNEFDKLDKIAQQHAARTIQKAAKSMTKTKKSMNSALKLQAKHVKHAKKAAYYARVMPGIVNEQKRLNRALKAWKLASQTKFFDAATQTDNGRSLRCG